MSTLTRVGFAVYRTQKTSTSTLAKTNDTKTTINHVTFEQRLPFASITYCMPWMLVVPANSMNVLFNALQKYLDLARDVMVELVATKGMAD